MTVFEERVRLMLERFPQRSDHPSWTLEEALEVFRAICPAASRAGWSLSVGGSTLREGVGQDLDLAAFPWREDADRLALVTAVEAHGRTACIDAYSASEEEALTQGGLYQAGFCSDFGHLIDLQIRFGPLAKRFVPERRT